MSYQPQPDQELLSLLQKDGERAISLIFKEHYAFLCKVIVRMVKDAHVAEDLAQDVFHDLWKRRDSLHISISIKAYLRRAGVNKTLNYIRDQKIKWDDEDKLPAVPSEAPSVADVLDNEDLERLLEKTIDELPERCRLVFTLSRYEDLSYKEIADSLGISVKTVENQMTKALKVLRGVISPFVSK